MMMTETSIGRIHCTHLADGKLVQLGGYIGGSELPALRLALLMPMAADCRDVVIDAGEVEAIDDAAVAVLMAAREWTVASGVRLLLSRSSLAFDLALQELDQADLLPRLASLEPTSKPLGALAAIPGPRPSAD